MIDRFGKEIDFSEIFMEETLSAKDKKNIPDDQWGLIIKNDKGEIVERKFPLNDETHVRQAAIFFDRAKGLSDDQKRELARNIVRRAKELDMDYSGWESLKPYLDKPVKESYELDQDSTSGTSDFDGYINDDEYYGEADQALMNQIQKNEDNIPILQLRTYAKKCLHEERSYNGGGKGYLFQLPQNDTNNQDKRCHGYFLNLIKEMDKSVDNQINRFYEYRPQKWFRYDKLINKFFSSIGVKYARDRVVTGIDSRKQCVHFLEKEFVKFRYDPTTDILIHRSDKKNLPYLKPSRGSLTEGIIYPKPRIYFTLEPRSKYSIKGAYGDNAYEPIISKPIDVYYDTESPAHISIDVSSDKYGKDVFINTYKPLAVRQITSDNTGNNQINQQQTGSQNMSPPPIKESFEEMFGPVIQEAFNAVTGEEIPIKHAYTMEEMKERTFSESELKHVKHNDDLVPVKRPDEDEVYFGSPTNYMPEIDLDGPLFVTPYKGLASIYVGRDIVKSKIPRGNYNLQYEEWGKLGEVDKPLSDVHVYVEGYPFLEQTVVEGEGYIHCVKTKDYTDNFYRYTWMNNREYLIANTDNMKVEFTRSIKCKVKYHIVGKPSPKGKQYGPSKSGILRYIHEIADKIHAKYKADQKEPTGNQNCLLCSWCAEASIRGGEYLPRPVYSPRDSALEIEPEDMITGIKRVNLKGGYHSLLSHLKSAKEPFARWYCHVKWSNSNGGHEFLIVKIDDNSFGIMDAQQGTVKPLNADDYHVKDIDWSESYICRIDDKPFKYMKLDQINDPKKTLPWDPKKDIPYMVKHGLCTKEEAEKELKKTETNLFNSELKKALGQTPIQETALPEGMYLRRATESDLTNIIQWKLDSVNPETRNDPRTIAFIKNDAKENLKDTKMIMYNNDLIGVLESCYIDNGEWWYIGEIYLIPEYRGRGFGCAILQREIDSHDKIKLRVSKNNTHAIDLYKSLGFNIAEEDEYAYIMTLVKDNIQEAATRDEKMIPIKPPKTDEVYFGSPTNYMPEIDLDRPLFVSPYKGIASIFIWGDMGLQDRIPKGSYNLNYEEWINFDEKKMKNPLKEVHVYLEGAPFLEPFTVEQEGYIHCISTKDYLNNFFRKPWMTKDLEYLIANTDNMKVAFTRSIKCKVKYYIKGKPAPKGKQYGPSKNGILRFTHEIADKIHAKYKADQKEPTGNQNCLLCSWCAEACMRGQDYLPRPIYSPRDPALNIEPEDVIKDVSKTTVRGFDNLMNHLQKVDTPFARWYCHVNWKDSTGGHEFLIVKVDDNTFGIFDPQQGTFLPLREEDYHFKDINWKNSYICRIDDKPFKYMKLDQINDPKKTLPWDPKKDIPYMVKHGMCTKEEAEKELKKTETNLFNSELKKALKETPVQESHTDLLDETFYRFEYDGEGIYEALRKNMSVDDWKDFKQSKAATWLPVPPNYQTGDQSFFTEKGYDKFMNITYPYITKYLKKSKIHKFETELNPKYIRYRDEYQVVFNKTKTFQESTIQEGLFFKKKEYHPLEISEVYQEFVDAYNDPIFKAIISEFKDRRSSLLSKWMNDTHPVDEVFTEEDNDGLVSRFLSKTQVDNFEVTNSRYETIGYGFATVRNPDEWLTISKVDGKVYYCEIRPDSIIADSFNEFLSSFGSTFKQYLTKANKPIQEGAWGDIRNGVNPWSMKRVFHISPEGHLDGQIFKPRVPEYLDEYDPSKTEFEDVETPRVCFSPSIEGCLNAILVNIGRWKTANKLRDWYVYIPEKPLKEYKYRTTRQLVDEKKVYDANLTKEIWIEEPVRLKQYGIIRIDSVTDVKREKAVPTTLGESKKRNVYNFKWHWLVKPKVLKDVPYDYSPEEVCKDMVSELSGFKYGLGYDGSIHHGSSKDFDEKYRIESPEEFEKNGGGICYDYVEWEAGYLEAYGYTCRKFYISTDTKDMDTHTFILVDDGNGKFIYPESAFKLLEGTHTVKFLDEAVDMIMKKAWDINDNKSKYDTIKYYVWEYKDHPPYGSDMKTCHEYFTKGEPIAEGMIKNPYKRKD